ncbi:murein biosynthesis integral membrane protein MurJ [Planctomicrobium piriforme]|uniref:Murein biosynthesis integral membrane protein MurJ n=1 Tax=Planctomicrobium piriforme TaxID=1576369 RepID=A0A1I3AUT7_9PLAN|nr:lipid II flippase MurJ [Planctomicrobium piriforme]SFH53773.1 murein biosynthesis integral membrane protein MurJ [Planctomicrobium piriforme]
MSSDAAQVTANRGISSYAVVFGGMLLQNLLLFALSIVLASLFGTSEEMDAFRTAFTPPLMLAAVFAGTGGPVLMTLLARRETSSAPGTATLILLLLTGVSLACAFLGFYDSELVMRGLHPWFDPKRQAESSVLFHILVWMLPLNTIIGLSQAVLNSSLNFVVPAISGVVGPIATLAAVWWLAPEWGIAGVAWATVWGAVASVVCQLPWLIRQLAWPAAGQLHHAWQQVGIAWPLLLGMGALKLDPLVDQFLGSSLEPGRISQLDYAGRILTPFLMLSSGTLSTVTFPRIARTAVAGGAPLRAEATLAFRTLMSLCVPAFVVLTTFAHPLVQDLLQRRNFTAADTLAVSQLVRVLSAMLLGAALSEVCSKMLYAFRDSLTPNLILTCCLLAGFGLKAVLVGPWGILGIAAVTSGVFVAVGSMQLWFAARRIGPMGTRNLVVHLLRCVIASAFAAAVGAALLQLPIPFPSVFGLTLGGILYFAVLVFSDSETRAFVKRLRGSRESRVESPEPE